MNSSLLKFHYVFIFLSGLLPLTALSQNLTGIWRGNFLTKYGEEYRFELQIEQTKTNRISGVSYSYLDTRFYGKATLTGNFTRASNSALIQEIKTVEVKMAGGSTACIMKCLFTYSKSGKEEFLEGTYTSAFEKSELAAGIRRGADCGGGKVFLRKVPTSDFYIEPFLRNKSKPKTVDSTVRKTPPKPQQKSQNKPLTTKRKPTRTNSPVAKNQPVNKPAKDTFKNQVPDPIVIEKKIDKPKINIPNNTRSRQNELVQTITVTSEEIYVRLYDNGEIDGDTISVYLDGKAIVTNKVLSTIPITVPLKINDENPEHTLVMVAENLGRIPPNTYLMIVQDGEKRYQVSITSTQQKNAMVRFRYQKKS